MLELIVQEIERQGFCHVPHILSSEELQGISHFFEANKIDFKPAMVGSQGQKKRVEAVRGDFTYWLDPQNPPEVFKNCTTFLNQLKQKLNTDLFLGLKEYECHLSYYPSGTFYKKHRDRFENNQSRTLSFVFYLHENWEDGNGGELAIYDSQGELLKLVEPLPGSFICFISEEFPHEVKSGTIERRSLSGWMHNKIIY